MQEIVDLQAQRSATDYDHFKSGCSAKEGKNASVLYGRKPPRVLRDHLRQEFQIWTSALMCVSFSTIEGSR